MPQRLEGMVDDGVYGGVSGISLPTANDDIDVPRIEFHPVAKAFNFFHSQQGRAGSQECVQDQSAPKCELNPLLELSADKTGERDLINLCAIS